MGRPIDQDYSVFVGDLGSEVDDEMLETFFANCYPSVRSANVIVDVATGRHKGYGFVRFGSEADRDRALAEMDGALLGSRAIRVSPATARRNMLSHPAAPPSSSGRVSVSSGGGSSLHGLSHGGGSRAGGCDPSAPWTYWGPGAPVVPPFTPSSSAPSSAPSSSLPHPADFDPTNTTLFIGGLSALVTEEQLHKIFAKYGDIIYTKVPRDKGCGFVQFVERSAAECALVEMNGAVIGNAAIRISWGRSASKAAAAMTAAMGGAGQTFPAYPPYISTPAGQYSLMQQYNMYVAAATAANYGVNPAAAAIPKPGALPVMPGAGAGYSGRDTSAGGPSAPMQMAASYPAHGMSPYMAYGYAYAPYFPGFQQPYGPGATAQGGPKAAPAQGPGLGSVAASSRWPQQRQQRGSSKDPGSPGSHNPGSPLSSAALKSHQAAAASAASFSSPSPSPVASASTVQSLGSPPAGPSPDSVSGSSSTDITVVITGAAASAKAAPAAQDEYDVVQDQELHKKLPAGGGGALELVVEAAGGGGGQRLAGSPRAGSPVLALRQPSQAQDLRVKLLSGALSRVRMS